MEVIDVRGSTNDLFSGINEIGPETEMQVGIYTAAGRFKTLLICTSIWGKMFILTNQFVKWVPVTQRRGVGPGLATWNKGQKTDESGM